MRPRLQQRRGNPLLGHERSERKLAMTSRRYPDQGVGWLSGGVGGLEVRLTGGPLEDRVRGIVQPVDPFRQPVLRVGKS